MNRKLTYCFVAMIVPLFSCTHHLKTGYVSLAAVYEKFPLTKEMESKLDNIKNIRKSLEDSMMWKINEISSELDRNPSQEKVKMLQESKQLYNDKKDFFEQDIHNTEQQLTQQVWKQINQYVKDYGEENGYDYILGADGSGAIMYGSKDNDISKEVSEYVNKRYQGTKR